MQTSEGIASFDIILFEGIAHVCLHMMVLHIFVYCNGIIPFAICKEVQMLHMYQTQCVLAVK
jgi:hypothetical protein